MRTFRLLLWPAGVALGVAAELHYFGWGDPGGWLPDLAVGWTLIACGLVAWSRRSDTSSGMLLAATGFVGSRPTSRTRRSTCTGGRLSTSCSRIPRAGSGAGSSGCRGHGLRDRPDPGRVAERGGKSSRSRWRSSRWRPGDTSAPLARARRRRLAALQATAFLAAVIAGTAITRLASTTQAAVDATLWVYEAALCALATFSPASSGSRGPALR